MSSPNQPKIVRLDVSFGTLFKITIYALALFIIGKALSLFILTYVALILASAFRPIVDIAKFLRIPRTIAVLLIYLGIIGFIVWIFSLIVPPVVSQTKDFITNIPQLAEQLSIKYSWFADIVRRYDLKTILSNLSDSLLNWSTSLSSGILTNAWTITSGVFGGLLGVFLVLVLTFYMLIGEQNLVANVVTLFPPAKQNDIRDLITSIQHKLGAWFRGQLVLCLLVGLLSFIGFSIVGIKYALPLALIAGLLEIVPYLGPWLTAFLAVAVALPSSLITAFGVAVVCLVVQQAENNVLVPLVMKHAVGLDPLFVLISLGVGSKILGVGGMILAVPAVVTIQIIIHFYSKFEKERQEEESTGSPTDTTQDVKIGDLFKKMIPRLKH